MIHVNSEFWHANFLTKSLVKNTLRFHRNREMKIT